MALVDDILSSYPRHCNTTRAFVLVAVQTIYSQITSETSKRQFEEAQAALLALCKRYEQQVAQQGLFHYQAAYGSLHTCVSDIYRNLSARLQNVAIMHQVTAQQPPKQQLITSEGAVIDLEDRMKTSSEETNLGTEDTTSS